MSNRLFPFFVARRYLFPTRRNRFTTFITVVSILGIMSGTAALLISLSILQGFDHTLRSTMIAFMGHIEVGTFQNRPSEGYKAMLDSVPATVPEVKAISPFVKREAIIRSKHGIEGILVKGILPETDVSTIRNHIIAGELAFTGAVRGRLHQIVIGERLANRLRTGIGDTLIVFGVQGMPTPENPPVIEQFVVSGIYRSGMAEYDDIYTYTSLDAAQRLFQMQADQVNGYDIRLYDIETASATAEKLNIVMGYPHYPQVVFDIFSSIFAWLELQRLPIPIVIFLITIVAAFNVASTMLMVVLEKTESIGVFGALGSRPRTIMAIFIGQGILIGGIGTLLGVFLSLAFTIVQQEFKLFSLDANIYMIDSVPVSLDIWHYIIVVTVTIGLSILSTIVPAYVATRVRPVLALRFK